MPTYSYQAINESGSTVTGEIEADSTDMANNILSARGYLPSRVVEKGQIVPSAFAMKLRERFTFIKPPELILFTKQFKTLIRAGIPILKIFKVIENQTENNALKDIILYISQDVEEGSSLHDALRQHPKAFSRL